MKENKPANRWTFIVLGGLVLFLYKTCTGQLPLSNFNVPQNFRTINFVCWNDCFGVGLFDGTLF